MRARLDELDWWSASAAERGHVLGGIVEELEDRQAPRRAADLHHLRLYSTRQAYAQHGAAAGGWNRGRPLQRRPRLSLNVVRSCVDTAVSQITRARPRPQFLTSGGNWDLHQRAKKRGRFVESVFHRCQAYRLGQRAFKDAAIFGEGYLHTYADGDRIQIDRVPPNEMIIDESEGIYGEPKNIFRVRIADKLVLKEMFPKKHSVIDSAPSPDERYYGRAHSARLCVVAQAWHLPSGPKAEDGRYAVTLLGKDGLLYDGEYAHQDAPFAMVRWNEDPYGWHGTGIPSELTGIQHEINQILRTIEANIYMGGNLKVFVPKGSIAKGQISNDLRGVLVETNGPDAPQFVVNDVASPQLFGHLQFLIEQAYGITGISAAMAQAAEPDRAESGRAKLVQRQTYSQRFLHVERQYEAMFMDLTNRSLEVAGDLANDGVSLTERFPGRWSMDVIDYADVHMEEEEGLPQVFPTSILPDTPAGKLAMVESLEARGYIGRAQAMKLLDFPDIDSEMNLELAPIELIDMRIEKMLDTGEYLAPHPRMDLELARERSLLAYQWAEERGCPEDRLETLGQFVDACNDMLAPPPAPPAAAGVAVGGEPTDVAAGGMAPPAFPEQAALPPAAPVAAA